MDSKEEAAAGQITAEAAEIYEAQFVPALFGQFAAPLVEAAGVGNGDRTLDVASGTGIVTRAALAAGASVTAIDINDGMNAVARRLAPDAAFHAGPAEALPFDDDAFDRTVCQFGLMFFADREQAVAEMARVTRPGGAIALAVFDNWENSPGYRDLIPLIDRIVGRQAADALKVPFCLGDPEKLENLLENAGLREVQVSEFEGTVHQPSLDHWLDTEIGGWTLATMVDAPTLDRLKAAAHEALADYVTEAGRVEFPSPAYFATAGVWKDTPDA